MDAGGSAVSKLSRDGAIDWSFGDYGFAITVPFIGHLREVIYTPSLANQKDGKVLAAGSYGPRPLLTRITEDGELDSTFGHGGSVLNRKIVYWGADRHLTDVEVDAKGRILVSGALWTRVKGESVVQGFVTRYRANGKLDCSFARNGRILFKGSGSPGVYFHGFEITRKGRIVVLRTNSKGTSAIALTPSGKLDRRFAKGRGFLRLPSASHLEAAPGGKLFAFGVSAGNASGEVAEGCARVFSFGWAGNLRKNFSRDGIRFICTERLSGMFPSFEGQSPSGFFNAGFTVQGDGKPVITLAIFQGAAPLSQPTIRFDPDGSIDRSFADDGVFRTRRASGSLALAGLPHGVLVGAGDRDPPVTWGDHIYRFSPDQAQR